MTTATCPEPVEGPLPPDLALIAAAQARATGETIHRLASFISVYQGYSHHADAEKMQRAADILRAFVASGQLPPRVNSL